MYSVNIEALTNLNAKIEKVLAAGGEITDHHQSLRQAWERHHQSKEEAAALIIENMIDLLIDPATPDTELAKATGHAMHITSDGVKVNDLTERVAEQLLPQMRAETKKSAPANYARVRADFNKTAQKLAKALEAANPAMGSTELAQADDKTRRAWLEQPILAQQLDGHLEALQAAAELAGADITTGHRSASHGSIAEQIKSRLIGLTIDTNGAHRRKVWEAWDNTTGNAGRWAALHELGCTIEAIKDPEELEPYRKPAPIEIYHEQDESGSWRVNLQRDPEDAEYEQQRFQPKKQAVTII